MANTSNVLSRSAEAMERAQEALRQAVVMLAQYGENDAMLRRMVQDRERLLTMAERCRKAAGDMAPATEPELLAG